MPQIINSNISALTAQRNLNKSQDSLATSLQRLSSGLRINSAKDDAAGLAISNRFSSQINGTNQAGRNANDGISLAQTAEGALQSLGDALDRIRVLAVQSANGTNTTSDRAALNAEVAQLTAEMQRIATSTQFNGQNILDGTLNAQFQVGANAGQTINFAISSSKTTALGTQTQYLRGNTATAAAAGGAGTAGSNAALALNRTLTQTLSIFGVGSCTTAITVNGTSAKSIADTINLDTKTTGVTAKATTAALIGAISTTGTVSFNLYGGTASAAVAATVSSTADLSSLADAINLVSATTGVNAVVNGAQITLTNSSGENITVEDYRNSSTTSATMTMVGLDGYSSSVSTSTVGTTVTITGTNLASDSATVGGQLKLDSSSIFSLSTNATGALGGLVNAATTVAVYATLNAVSSVSIATVQGANNTIDVIDGALATVNTLRANLGALQNRFTTTVSNLEIAAENMSAARSRIQDADFGAETTALSRSQILQQAGIASLAQANALPNNVLALLQ